MKIKLLKILSLILAFIPAMITFSACDGTAPQHTSHNLNSIGACTGCNYNAQISINDDYYRKPVGENYVYIKLGNMSKGEVKYFRYTHTEEFFEWGSNFDNPSFLFYFSSGIPGSDDIIGTINAQVYTRISAISDTKRVEVEVETNSFEDENGDIISKNRFFLDEDLGLNQEVYFRVEAEANLPENTFMVLKPQVI